MDDYRLNIEKGNHWFTPVRPLRFKEDYISTISAVPMQYSAYVNKAIGISQSLNPHKNSIRIGWRRDKDLKVHWYWYIYENGKRTITEIEGLAGKETIFVAFKYMFTDVKNSSIGEHIGLYVSCDDFSDSYKANFKPRWVTHFYWGGSEPYPGISESVWLNTNINYVPTWESYYAAAFSKYPFTVTFLPVLAMFLTIVGIAQISSTLAVVLTILMGTLFLGYVLLHNVNYEKWIKLLGSLKRRLKLSAKVIKRSITSKLKKGRS